MTAKKKAIEDIKEDLLRESRSFLAFRRKLDPVMQKMVSDYIELQKEAGNGQA